MHVCEAGSERTWGGRGERRRASRACSMGAGAFSGTHASVAPLSAQANSPEADGHGGTVCVSGVHTLRWTGGRAARETKERDSLSPAERLFNNRCLHFFFSSIISNTPVTSLSLSLLLSVQRLQGRVPEPVVHALNVGDALLRQVHRKGAQVFFQLVQGGRTDDGGRDVPPPRAPRATTTRF